MAGLQNIELARISQEVATKKLQVTLFPVRNMPWYPALLQELSASASTVGPDVHDAAGRTTAEAESEKTG
jgi:hypothetical protein